MNLTKTLLVFLLVNLELKRCRIEFAFQTRSARQSETVVFYPGKNMFGVERGPGLEMLKLSALYFISLHEFIFQHGERRRDIYLHGLCSYSTDFGRIWC
jgi:hypothetical protein